MTFRDFVRIQDVKKEHPDLKDRKLQHFIRMYLALSGSGSFCHIGKLAEFGASTRLDLKIAKKMALWATSRQMPETMKKVIKARRRLCLRERVMAMRNYVCSSIYPGQIWNNDKSNGNATIKFDSCLL